MPLQSRPRAQAGPARPKQQMRDEAGDQPVYGENPEAVCHRPPVQKEQQARRHQADRHDFALRCAHPHRVSGGAARRSVATQRLTQRARTSMLRCGDSTIAATHAAHAAAETYNTWRSAPGTPAASEARRSGETRSTACSFAATPRAPHLVRRSPGARHVRPGLALCANGGALRARQVLRCAAARKRRERHAPLLRKLTL